MTPQIASYMCDTVDFPCTFTRVYTRCYFNTQCSMGNPTIAHFTFAYNIESERVAHFPSRFISFRFDDYLQFGSSRTPQNGRRTVLLLMAREYLSYSIAHILAEIKNKQILKIRIFLSRIIWSPISFMIQTTFILESCVLHDLH